MGIKILILLILLLFPNVALSAEATMGMGAKIVNLTLIPIEEAVAFCIERQIDCPAIFEEYEEETGKNPEETEIIFYISDRLVVE